MLYYRPAVGSIENQYAHPKIKVLVDVRLSLLHFDAQFNGYHHSVIDDLLPYDNKEQAYSFWISQQHQQCRALFRYHGLVYSFMPVYGLNDKHSEYPRGVIDRYNITCYREFQKSPLSYPINHLQNYLSNLTADKKLLKFMSRPKTPIQKYSNDSLAVMEKNCKYYS